MTPSYTADNPEIITLDRKRWIHGETGEHSYLFRSDGCSCCIGQACQHYGLRENAIFGIGTVGDMDPEDVPEALRVMAVDLDGKYFDGVFEVYEENDNNEVIDDDERIRRINVKLDMIRAPFRFA
jgi:hypothetical protein